MRNVVNTLGLIFFIVGIVNVTSICYAINVSDEHERVNLFLGHVRSTFITERLSLIKDYEYSEWMQDAIDHDSWHFHRDVSNLPRWAYRALPEWLGKNYQTIVKLLAEADRDCLVSTPKFDEDFISVGKWLVYLKEIKESIFNFWIREVANNALSDKKRVSNFLHNVSTYSCNITNSYGKELKSVRDHVANVLDVNKHEFFEAVGRRLDYLHSHVPSIAPNNDGCKRNNLTLPYS